MTSDIAIAIGLAAFLAFVFLVLWLGTRMRKPDAPAGDASLQSINNRVETVEETVGQIQHDLRNVKMVVQNLPSKDGAHRLEVELTALAGKVGKVEAEVTSTSRAVDRIEDILLRSIK